MPNQKTKQKNKSQTILRCPFCKKRHHASECDTSLSGMIASALNQIAAKCKRCNNPTLGGPFCVECTIDRALERILAKQ